MPTLSPKKRKINMSRYKMTIQIGKGISPGRMHFLEQKVHEHESYPGLETVKIKYMIIYIVVLDF